jgi:type IV pilus assembly protein PilW
LGCGLTYTTTTDATSVSQVMAPVIVNPATTQVPAGDPNTDTLLVFSTNSNGSSEGDVLTAASTVSGSGGTYQVMTPSTFNVGDYVVGQVLARAATCALTLDRIKTKSGSTLTTKIGTSGFLINDLLFNLGSSLSIQAYAVRNGNLTVCDYMAYNCGKSSYASPIDSNVWVPISSNVVSLRAEYGRDTSNIGTSSMSGILDTYDQITPGSAADSSGLLPYCSWARVVGLRIAAVTRSAEYDKTKPTSAAPTWAGSTVTTSTPVNAIALPIVLSNDSSWQYYRYKTLQTVIPMRTMIWSGSQATYQGGSAGC